MCRYFKLDYNTDEGVAIGGGRRKMLLTDPRLKL
jgi:hypothetical protein